MCKYQFMNCGCFSLGKRTDAVPSYEKYWKTLQKNQNFHKTNSKNLIFFRWCPFSKITLLIIQGSFTYK